MKFLPRIPSTLLATFALVLPLLLMAALHWHHIPLLPNGTAIGIPDPDPWLRLTIVRDWLLGGDWYSHLVPRTNAPLGGISSPWTRPLDVVIAAITQLQPDDVPLYMRLIRASLLLPALWMALFIPALLRCCRAMCVVPATPFTLVLLFTIMPLWAYFSLGYADHHTPLMVLFVWALSGLLPTQPTRRDLTLSGACFGLMLWMSPEALALIAAAYGWFGVQWLRTGDRASLRPLVHLATSVAAISMIAVGIERLPGAWLTPIYDSISIVYVALLSGVALLAYSLTRMALPSLAARAGASFLGASALLLVLRYFFPLVLDGPMAGVDPYILTHFLPNIAEAHPLISRPPLYVLAMIIQPLLALTALVLCLRYPCIYTRTQALKLGYFLLVTLAMFLSQQRWYYYSHPIALIAVAPWLASLLNPEDATVAGRIPARWIAALPARKQIRWRLPIILLVVSIQGILLYIAPDGSTPASKTIDGCNRNMRSLIHSGALNKMLGRTPLTLLTATDLGAEVLFFTPYRIVASNYHREGTGIRYVWESGTITDAAALQRALAERGVGAVLLCTSQKITNDSVFGHLLAGNAPPGWLQKLPFQVPNAKPGENPMIFVVR